MPRTTAQKVQAILGDNYGPGRDGNCPSLQPFIDRANLTVTRAATCATAAEQPLTTEELEMMERYLAAHFYVITDPLEKSKSNLGASASYARGDSDYKDAAITLDPSGCLADLLTPNKMVASGGWLGTPARDVQTWDDRNL